MQTIKPQVEANLSKTYEKFEAANYRQQVVAGMNYHIRVLTKESGQGEEGCIHVRVFTPLPHTGSPPELHAIKVANETDELGLLEREL